jgi:hypothetical protein
MRFTSFALAALCAAQALLPPQLVWCMTHEGGGALELSHEGRCFHAAGIQVASCGAGHEHHAGGAVLLQPADCSDLSLDSPELRSVSRLEPECAPKPHVSCLAAYFSELVAVAAIDAMAGENTDGPACCGPPLARALSFNLRI